MLGDLQLSELQGTDPEELAAQEWLVTNGLGGYASGTLLGPHTRKYHGLFVPNLVEPNGRHVLLSMLSEQLLHAGGTIELAGARAPDGRLASQAHEHLERFTLEAGIPQWQFAAGDLRWRRRVVMPHGRNFVCVHYDFGAAGRAAQEGARASARLQLRPYVAMRRHDQEPDEGAARRTETCVRLDAHRPLLELRLFDSALVLRVALLGADADFLLQPRSLLQHYSLEADRGYHAHGADYSPGCFALDVGPGTRFALVAFIEPMDLGKIDADALFDAEQRRVRSLLELAGDPQDALAARLVVAADQFIITPGNRPEEAFRAETSGRRVRTVVAGYHWFGDWGRDTMISLEGLTLCTGRHAEAEQILRTFTGYVRDGLVPNLFPEGAREALYHTVDATLWMFHALDRYCTWTGDLRLVAEVMPVLDSICDHYTRGTRYGIGVDPADGLVRAGAAGYQLTWMDAKAGDWVVTPRRGKPVEIQALWYNALLLMAGWRTALELAPADHAERAARVRESFNRRFWYGEGNHLFDVIDGEQGDDPSGRPNQVFALSLRHAVLEDVRWAAVMDYVRQQLLTPFGLRTLDPRHPDYKSSYHGDLLTRDGAYHQGTVWPWLIGHYVDAESRLASATGADAPRGALDALQRHLTQFGIGSIAEIFDAETPFRPRGCIAQAWSVAEVLRARLRLLR